MSTDSFDSAHDPTHILAQVLQLTTLKIEDEAGVSEFRGPVTPSTSGARVFGGKVMAQALLAASHTVADSRPVHSMHCYFVRPGDASAPIDYRVDHHRDGRSFSARHVTAQQGNKTILTLTCSFQDPAPGAEYAAPMPQNVPAPEEIPSLTQMLQGTELENDQSLVSNRPIDMRFVHGEVFSKPGEIRADNLIWMKTFGPLEGDRNIQSAAMAFGSDYSLLEPALRVHGRAWRDPKLSMASLDHAMWFHRPARIDEWLLYSQETASTQSGRALVQGRFYTRDGELVASVAQEGMVRHRDD